MVKKGSKRELRTAETLPKLSILDYPLTQGRLLAGALIFALIVIIVAVWLPAESRGFWLGISVFIVGWIFTAAIDIRNRVKQHTFDLMLRTRFEDSFLKSMHYISQRYWEVEAISEDEAKKIWDAKNNDDVALRQHVANILNYYEMISISVYYKDADEQLLREYFNDLLIGQYRRLRNFLTLWRGKDPEAFVYLEWLYKQWNEEKVPVQSHKKADLAN